MTLVAGEVRTRHGIVQESTLPLKAVARQTGLGDASTLWRLFTRQLGVTPAEYRERFASALGTDA